MIPSPTELRLRKNSRMSTVAAYPGTWMAPVARATSTTAPTITPIAIPISPAPHRMRTGRSVNANTLSDR